VLAHASDVKKGGGSNDPPPFLRAETLRARNFAPPPAPVSRRRWPTASSASESWLQAIEPTGNQLMALIDC
jgi:hypothetical protein